MNNSFYQMAGGLPIASKAEIDAAWARRKYVRYCEHVHHGSWIPGRHHRLICSKLDEVTAGKKQRLMIWMPPQHGKSMAVTETFPSYFLGRHPDLRVMEASYNDNFAKKFGRKNRTKMQEFGFALWGLSLSDINATASNWDLQDQNGGMISVGFGGAATGEGADLLIVDDPIKNRKEADSKTMRDYIWDEYRSTFLSRLHPGGSIIIVMTRWHEDDLCGRLLNPEYVEEVEDWDIVALPAIAESPDDLLGRQIGEALWPEHGYDEEWVRKQKARIGSYAFAGLYQQRPAPMEGGMFKRKHFRYYTALPDGISQMVQSWDCTFKEAEDNDFVAGHVWGKKGPNYYLMDRVHDRMGIMDTMQGIRALEAKHPSARAKGIEEAANGAAVIELLKNTVSGIIPIKPDGGKIARAQYIVPYLEGGNIYLPDPSIAPWIHDFIEEFVSFPNAAHDDDVDAADQAIKLLDRLFGSGGGIIYRPYTEAPEAYQLPRTILENRMKDPVVGSLVESVTVGVASESTSFGTSFVASALSMGAAQVYAVASHECPNNATPDEIAAALLQFCQMVAIQTGKQPEYIVVGGDNDILYRTIKTRMEANGIFASIRTTVEIPEKDMISLTLSTMSGRKLILSQEDTTELQEAFMIAQWKEDKTERDNDGAANTLVLKAFERSIERNRRNLIT